MLECSSLYKILADKYIVKKNVEIIPAGDPALPVKSNLLLPREPNRPKISYLITVFEVTFPYSFLTRYHSTKSSFQNSTVFCDRVKVYVQLFFPWHHNSAVSPMLNMLTSSKMLTMIPSTT